MMRKLGVYALSQSPRGLFKKWSFWLLLLAVPLLVLGMRGIAAQKASVLTMVFFAEPSEDGLGAEIARQLEASDGLICYDAVRLRNSFVTGLPMAKRTGAM